MADQTIPKRPPRNFLFDLHQYFASTDNFQRLVSRGESWCSDLHECLRSLAKTSVIFQELVLYLTLNYDQQTRALVWLQQLLWTELQKRVHVHNVHGLFSIPTIKPLTAAQRTDFPNRRLVFALRKCHAKRFTKRVIRLFGQMYAEFSAYGV